MSPPNALLDPTAPALPLAGWHSWRWSGSVLVATGPDGRNRSLGEIERVGREYAVLLLGPDGAELATETAETPDEARAALHRHVREHGGHWPEPPPETPGAWCRRLRLKGRMTQEQLAKRVRELNPDVNVGLARVSEFERGLPSKPLQLEHLEAVFGPYPYPYNENPGQSGATLPSQAETSGGPASCGGSDGVQPCAAAAGGPEPDGNSPAVPPAPIPAEEQWREAWDGLDRFVRKIVADNTALTSRVAELEHQVELGRADQAELARLRDLVAQQSGQLEAVRRVLGGGS